MLIVLLQILASLKVFDQIYQMTAGGPDGSTRPMVQYIFETGFTGYRLGYAAAISYIFFAIIVAGSLVQFVITLPQECITMATHTLTRPHPAAGTRRKIRQPRKKLTVGRIAAVAGRRVPGRHSG